MLTLLVNHILESIKLSHNTGSCCANLPQAWLLLNLDTFPLGQRRTLVQLTSWQCRVFPCSLKKTIVSPWTKWFKPVATTIDAISVHDNSDEYKWQIVTIDAIIGLCLEDAFQNFFSFPLQLEIIWMFSIKFATKRPIKKIIRLLS